MNASNPFSRRAFVAAALSSPLAVSAGTPFFSPRIPVGLELYSVRDDLKADPMATLTAVAGMGYQCVEFYAPYFEWTPDYAKQIRAKLDELKIQCHSTHNSLSSFNPKNLDKAKELNQILGAKYIVCASPGVVKSADDWKKVADILNTANEHLAPAKMHTGYHNHDLEWHPIDGQMPMEILAKSTDKSVMLQLDVGTCVEAGHDPVEWINANPGRIRSLHLKEWSPDKGYKVLFGEGTAPWKAIFAAAEKKGGVEFYLIEQEGSRFSEKESAQKCLEAYKELRHA
jgi:sugar phosphate isomerase/epimerase